MMLAYTDACVLPRYLVLPPPIAAAPGLVQTFFVPVETPVPPPPPPPVSDARRALCSFFVYVYCFGFSFAFFVFVWAVASGWHRK